MKTPSRIIVLILFSIPALFFLTAMSGKAAPSPGDELRGAFDYVANYESGSRAGTQTTGHRVIVESLPDGQYQLSWGDLKVMGTRIGDGLIYKWQSGEISGEGIYIIYDHGEKLFGTFRLKDANGEQRGYTQGTRVRLN
jgi:hypothetical protein